MTLAGVLMFASVMLGLVLLAVWIAFLRAGYVPAWLQRVTLAYCIWSLVYYAAKQVQL